jgi:RNA polymerase sigma-70 factor (ECF subfamily)
VRKTSCPPRVRAIRRAAAAAAVGVASPNADAQSGTALRLVAELTASSAPPRGPLAPERDRLLVARILGGSREHFDELYESYFRRVFRFALKRLGDPAEAEDVTQEVFETIFRALPSYRGDSSLLVWIFGITRNKVNRRFRGARPRVESLDDVGVEIFAADCAPTDAAVDAKRMLDRCDQVVSERLTPLQRRIFHLKHLRRQPIRTIAETLGKSEDAIKANLYRMRRALTDGAPGLDGFLS